MDSGCHKLYHEHDFDSREHLETYYSGDQIFADDAIKFPLEQLHHAFNEGHIKGELLIDISISSILHHLYLASGCFQQISVLKLNEKCIIEMNRWINTRTGAFDWTYASTYVTELEQNDDPVHEKDMKLKTAIVKIVKCDLEKENITDPVVHPPADCIISGCLLDVISKDQDEYIRNVKKITTLLNPGGQLILFGILNASYFTTGQHRYHVFKYDEDFIKKVLIEEGFTINCCKVQNRKTVSDLIDYSGVIFIIAQKGN